MGARLDTVVQGDDVRVTERLEDLDLAIEILFELLVQTSEFDRLDGDGGIRYLSRSTCQRLDHLVRRLRAI